METTNATTENGTDPESNQQTTTEDTGDFDFDHGQDTTTTLTPVEIADLTSFQKAILAVLADDSRYGLAIKRELEEYYGENVNHGRLYPNLDTLVDKGLVVKSELDKRTNEYTLTPIGRDAIQQDVLWLVNRVEYDAPKNEERGA